MIDMEVSRGKSVLPGTSLFCKTFLLTYLRIQVP